MRDLPLTHDFLASPHRYLFHAPSSTAILADMHLGAEAELTRRGIFMPDVSGNAIRAAWASLAARLATAKQSHLVIAGDLFDVPTPDALSVATAVTLLKQLPPTCRITLIPGNHDPAPETLTLMFQGIPLVLANAVTVGGYTVLHGHESQHAIGFGDGQWLGEDATRQWIPRGLIAGHQHPAVILRNRVQSAKMPCFAACTLIPKIGRKKIVPQIPLILLPTFSRAPLGSNLSQYNWIVDLPRPDDKEVRILGVIEGPEPQVLDFGTLASLRLPF